MLSLWKRFKKKKINLKIIIFDFSRRMVGYDSGLAVVAFSHRSRDGRLRLGTRRRFLLASVKLRSATTLDDVYLEHGRRRWDCHCFLSSVEFHSIPANKELACDGGGEIDENRWKFKAFFNEDESFAFDVPTNEPKTLNSPSGPSAHGDGSERRWRSRWLSLVPRWSFWDCSSRTDQGQAKVAKKTSIESLGRSSSSRGFRVSGEPQRDRAKLLRRVPSRTRLLLQ